MNEHGEPTRVAFRLVYDAGKEARSAGKPHTANPHKSYQWEWAAWLKGWGGQPDKRISPHLKR